MVYGVSLDLTIVEHMLQKRGTVSLVFLFVYILRYPSLSLCAVLSSVHKSRSVVKLQWCPQNRFKSSPFVSPSRNVLRCSHHSLSSSLVLCSYPGISHRLHLVNSAKNKLCVRAIRAVRICVSWALRRVQYPFFDSSAYSLKYETWSILSSAHWVKCEACLLVSPRTL